MFHIILELFDEDEALKIAKLLVASYCCDPLRANSSGKTPFHIAIEWGHISITQYLLSLDIPLSPHIFLTLDPRGKWKTAEMVCFLVKNGADVHGCAHTGDSVFHIILRFLDEDEALEIAKLLVTSYDCDSLRANSSGITPFHIAIEQGHISVAQYLLSLGIPLPPHIPAMLIPWGWLWVTKQMTQFLLKNGVDVHECTGTGDTLFHIALNLFDEDEALEIAKFLVTSHDCDPLRANSFGKTLFDIAIERGHIDVTQYFLYLGIPLPPHILVTFLVEPYYEWTRSKAKTVEMVCFLVKNGADVHACTTTGDTVLHITLESFDEDKALKIAKLLVTNYGCDPLRANSSKQTSFHIAIKWGHISVMRYLLSLGVHLFPDILVTGCYTWPG